MSKLHIRCNHRQLFINIFFVSSALLSISTDISTIVLMCSSLVMRFWNRFCFTSEVGDVTSIRRLITFLRNASHAFSLSISHVITEFGFAEDNVVIVVGVIVSALILFSYRLFRYHLLLLFSPMGDTLFDNDSVLACFRGSKDILSIMGRLAFSMFAFTFLRLHFAARNCAALYPFEVVCKGPISFCRELRRATFSASTFDAVTSFAVYASASLMFLPLSM